MAFCLQVCNHPYLFNIDAEPHFDGISTNEDIVEASGKMMVRAASALLSVNCAMYCQAAVAGSQASACHMLRPCILKTREVFVLWPCS